MLTATVHAQHRQHIATDYNSCLNGVQNERGVWVIRPIYEQVGESPFGYIVSLSGKYGVVNFQGRELIPLKYDYVDEAFYYYYYYTQDTMPPSYKVMLNGKYGVVDTTGRIIVPIYAEQIYGNLDTVFTVQESEDTWCFYNYAGTRFACPWKTISGPSRLMPHVYSVSKRKFFGARLYGMVNDSGRIVLPQEYNHLSGFTDTRAVLMIKKGNYGYCDGAGKIAWPLTFNTPDGYRYYPSDANLLGRLGRGPAWRNEKCGMVSVTGDSLLPFIYDDITSFTDYPSKRETGNLWIVEKDHLKGIYDDVNGWRIPVSCSVIETIETFYADGDSAQVGLMLYLKQGMWGVITTSGQEILPCEYEEMCQDYYGNYVLRKGEKLVTVGVVTYQHMEHLYEVTRNYGDHTITSGGRNTENEVAPASKIFATFQGEENTIVYYHPRLVDSLIHIYQNYINCTTGNYYDMVAPDSVVRSGCFYVQELGTPDIRNGNVMAYQLDYLQLHSKGDGIPDVIYVTSNKEEKTSVVDRYAMDKDDRFYITGNDDVVAKNGRLVISGDNIDRCWGDHHGATGELFFAGYNAESYFTFDTNGVYTSAPREGMVGDYSDKYIWRDSHFNGESWTVTDIKTGVNLFAKKEFSASDAPIWDSITLVDNAKNGIRLYNIPKRKYLTVRGFSYIIPLSMKGDLFAVKTCLGNMGILRANGTWLTDTIWSAFTPMGEPTVCEKAWNTNLSFETRYYPYYVFSNDTGSSLLEISGSTFASTDKNWNFIWNYSTRTSTSWYSDVEHFDKSGKRMEDTDVYQPYFLLPRYDTTKYKDWQKHIAVDSMFGSLRYNLIEYYSETELEETEEYYDIDEEDRTNRYCWDCGKKYQHFLWTRHASIGEFATFHANDSVMSFSHVWAYHWNGHISRSYCSNVFLYPEGPRNMTLDSIFNPNSDWRNLVINAVLDYVNTHSGIEGDCHNPAALPLLLNNSWLINNEKLVLYPPGFSEDNHSLEVSIDFKTYSPYLRGDVKSKITGK